MLSSREAGSVRRSLICLLLTVMITTGHLVSASPRNKNQFFTTCWGWGASCTMHNAVGRAFPPAFPSTTNHHHAQRVEPSSGRQHPAGIPSMVTSGTWEPGTMGKRMGSIRRRQQDLMALLERVVKENNMRL